VKAKTVGVSEKCKSRPARGIPTTRGIPTNGAKIFPGYDGSFVV
jgi:hypothetical protein